MVSEELRSAHHMKDEEGGGQKQRLVHRRPLSHVPSLGLSHSSLCQSEGRGGEEDEGEGGRERGGRRGSWPKSPHAECVGFPPGG